MTYLLFTFNYNAIFLFCTAPYVTILWWLRCVLKLSVAHFCGITARHTFQDSSAGQQCRPCARLRTICRRRTPPIAGTRDSSMPCIPYARHNAARPRIVARQRHGTELQNSITGRRRKPRHAYGRRWHNPWAHSDVGILGCPLAVAGSCGDMVCFPCIPAPQHCERCSRTASQDDVAGYACIPPRDKVARSVCATRPRRRVRLSQDGVTGGVRVVGCLDAGQSQSATNKRNVGCLLSYI